MESTTKKTFEFYKCKKFDENFDSSNISVVVQGPVSDVSVESLESVRKFLPDSKIILSTWEGSDVSGLDFDEVVFSKDPHEIGKKYSSNVNRMLVSSLNGLKAVKTEYTLKIRTDFKLTGLNFLNFFSCDCIESKELRLFKKPLVAYAWKSRRGRLFHIGDFYFFGLSEDILSLFDIPLVTEEEDTWLKNNSPKNNYRVKGSNKFHPEQHLWIKFLEKNNISIDLVDYTDYSEDMRIFTEKTFANNIIVASFFEFSIVAIKESLFHFNLPLQRHLYMFNDWVFLCRKYIDKDYVPAFTPPRLSLPKVCLAKTLLVSARALSYFIPSSKKRKGIRIGSANLAAKLFI